MDRLETLRKSLLAMDRDELQEFIRQLRIDRRITKDKPAAVVKKKKASEKSKSNIATMLAKLSATELAKLLGDFDATDESEGNTAS